MKQAIHSSLFTHLGDDTLRLCLISFFLPKQLRSSLCGTCAGACGLHRYLRCF